MKGQKTNERNQLAHSPAPWRDDPHGAREKIIARTRSSHQRAGRGVHPRMPDSASSRYPAHKKSAALIVAAAP